MSEPTTGVPLAWRDDQAGYQCPYCSLYVAIPKRKWAVCPRCPGIPVDETAALLLTEEGFDEDETTAAVDALRVLLAALSAHLAPPGPARAGDTSGGGGLMGQLVCACTTSVHEPDCPNRANDWHYVGATMYRGPKRVHLACPAEETAYLSVPNPKGARLRCGLLDDHYGPHVFHMEWTDPPTTAVRPVWDAGDEQGAT